MRTNPKTIKLAKIRYYIRRAIRWHKVDNGMPTFWTKEDYKKSKKVLGASHLIGNYPYYVKSDKAIREMAEKIYDLMNERETVHVRINDHELKMLNSGASLSRLTDNAFLKIYHSNYKEKRKK